MEKRVSDYVAKVQERFPMFSWTEVYNILVHGLRMYTWANKMHCDVAIYQHNNPNEILSLYSNTCYTPDDVLKHYKYWKMKWKMKERVLYRLRHEEWDGYYYIGLYGDDGQHEALMRQGKMKTLRNVYLTKIKKELHHEKYIKYIWRVKWPADCGWKFFVEKYTSDEIEFVEENNYEKYHQCFLGRYDAGSGTVIYPTKSTD